MNFLNRNIYKMAITGDENMIAHWEAVVNDYAKHLIELNMPKNIVDFQSESIHKGVIALVNVVMEPAQYNAPSTLYIHINYPEPEREYDLRLRYDNGHVNIHPFQLNQNNPHDRILKETCLFDEWSEGDQHYYHFIATETMEIPIVCGGFSFERIYR